MTQTLDLSYEAYQAYLLHRWLWALPLCVLAMVLVIAVRGEPIKAWVERLRGGQMLMCAGSLILAGFLPFALGILVGSTPLWVLGFIPVGAVSAVLALWFWFGTRAKTKGGV